jgi:inositol transport system permease protein
VNKNENAKKFNFGEFYGKWGTLLILVVIVVLATLFVPNFIKPQNLLNVLLQNAVVAMLAFGASFVILLGHTNVAYGSELAFIGCIDCLVMIQLQQSMSPAVAAILALLVSIVVGAILGLINGYIITKFDIPAFIMTLAVTTIARGGALLLTNGTPVAGMDDAFNWFGQGYIGPIPTSVVIMIVLFIIAWVLMNKTRFGRHVYAVGGNRNAAEASGISATGVNRKVFLLDGIFTGIAALVFMARQASGTPAGGVSYEFDAITAVVVGGTSLAGGSGNVSGTILGAFIVGIINNVQNLLHINTYWQQVVKGIVILLAVIIDVVTKRAAAKAKK